MEIRTVRSSQTPRRRTLFFTPGSQNIDQLSGHLASTTRRPRQPIGPVRLSADLVHDTAAAFVSNLCPLRSTAQMTRASLAASATTTVLTYGRTSRLRSQLPNSVAAIVETCCDAWKPLITTPSAVQSIPTRLRSKQSMRRAIGTGARATNLIAPERRVDY